MHAQVSNSELLEQMGIKCVVFIQKHQIMSKLIYRYPHENCYGNYLRLVYLALIHRVHSHDIEVWALSAVSAGRIIGFFFS
jgi:hypothetical protein